MIQGGSSKLREGEREIGQLARYYDPPSFFLFLWVEMYGCSFVFVLKITQQLLLH